jgi:hypothetical protein
MFLSLIVAVVILALLQQVNSSTKEYKDYTPGRTGVVQLGDDKLPPVIKKALDYASIIKTLPPSFDYRPKGLLTTDLNQHIPVYW